MKTYVVLMGLFSLLACTDKKSNSRDGLDFILAQDTVMIDPNGSIINLKYGLTSPELSSDGKYLFHYVYGEAKFNKINLEGLVLEKTIQFEREGPDGMGTFPIAYALTTEDQFMIWSYGVNALFDQEAKNVRDLKLTKIAPELQGPETYPIRLMEHHTDPNQIFGLYQKMQEKEFFLVKFDLENETYKKIPLPETEKLNEYQMAIEQGGRPAGGFGPSPLATIHQDKIVLTNSSYNEAYVYDIRLDSLYLISWNSTLTGNQNEYKLPKTAEVEQAYEHRKKYLESINFMVPKWDPISQRYIRVSFKTKFAEDLNEYGMVDEVGAEVFLTVLDKDLNIVKETFLYQYQNNPRSHFFVDSKIWFFENIEDELGFVRFTID